MIKALRWIGRIILALLLLVIILLLTLTITEYRPADSEAVPLSGAAGGMLSAGDSLTVMTWNTGYAALGDNADFFMDGGTMVQTADEARVRQNLDTMAAAISAIDPDLLFLQEVDVQSDRSCRINELALYQQALSGRMSAYATNFRVLYVPYPVPPIGHVDGGIATFSKAAIASAERLQLPCPFSWPVRLGNLKRCLLVTRIPLANSDRELVAINLHLEAYDDGSGKVAQTARLAEVLQAEVQKGNYVIAGGDFNQVFTGVDMSAYPVHEGMWTPGEIDPAALGDGLTALMDAATPTCRSLDRPLSGADVSNFQFYMIDGFIVSDNVAVELLETQSLGFVATDHNPVVMRVTLLPDAAEEANP